VRVSRVASLPEVCGDVALYIDPNQAEDLAIALLMFPPSTELKDSSSTKVLSRPFLFS